MITISVCMIVKNEEERLGTCLESLKTIADEIIIVDTGSSDATKEVAARYTDKIYDFAWTGSFSDARNYSFSLATGDYIYCADADEELDSENIDKFLMLKNIMDPEIDIVQMYYCNQLENNTIYSYDRELRPKLYKRLRTWMWESDIHEAVRLNPVIYDSEIDIIHRPTPGHAVRDLKAFERLIENGESISKRLIEIYEKELVIAGEPDNMRFAVGFFDDYCESEDLTHDELARAFAVNSICHKRMGDMTGFLKYALRAAAGDLLTSEICFELGDYYEKQGDIPEALMWYSNAYEQAESYLDIRYQNEYPNKRMQELMP